MTALSSFEYERRTRVASTGTELLSNSRDACMEL